MTATVRNLESKENPAVKEFVKLRDSARERRKKSLFITEGARLSYDAAISNTEIKTLFYTIDAKEKYFRFFDECSKKAKEIYEITNEISYIMGDTQNPQGIFMICRYPKTKEENEYIKEGKFIACDRVQDPSNMGSVLRTAEALGISGIILSEDSCDIYNPKVIRGSMGACFRINVITVKDLSQTLKEASEKGFETYAAVAERKASDIRKIAFSQRDIVVIGNEGNGISEKVASECKNKITIPMPGLAESLNASVSAAIIMWEMIKR